MLERHIIALRTDDPGSEEPAATRERLRAEFAPGATRRMTQLGMLVGATLGPLHPAEDDAIIYASSFGESRALEAYLESFPFPSPTLFQTSIHPSGVQQGLIGRQRAVSELLPIAAGPHLTAHALLAAMLSPAARVLVCGGEERGTWLLEHGVASDRAFAFALALARSPGDAPLGRVVLRAGDPVAGGAESPTEPPGSTLPRAELPLAGLFDLLHRRQAFAGGIAPGWLLELTWS